MLAACAALAAAGPCGGSLGAQASPAPRAPLRGRALFDLLGREPLLAGDSTEPVHWLPDGSGWYVAASTRGFDFQRVDARSGRRTPLLDEPARAALRSQYARLVGLDSATVPAREIAYADHSIVFAAGGRSYRFDPRSDTLVRLPRARAVSVGEAEGVMRGLDTSQLVLGSRSPDLSRIAYVRGYDLYMSDATGLEVQLTTGGREELMNGRPDWVYAEELGQRDGFWWSPDGSRIAYLQWDEQPVERHTIVHELASPERLEQQRYPRAGARLPQVRLFVVDLRSGHTREIDTRAGAQEGDAYILKPIWLSGGDALAFQRLNRQQTVLELLLADVASGRVRTLVREKDPELVSLDDDVRFLAAGRRFIWSSERSGGRQLYLYDGNGVLLRQLTGGDGPVQHLVQVDERNGWVYFTAARNDGLDSQLFKVRLDGSHLVQLTTDPGVHRPALDPTMTYFTDRWSSLARAPRTDLRTTADGKLVRTLDSTDTVRLDALGLAPAESLTVLAADGATALHGLLFRPAGFDSTRSYPLVVSVHGGPHAQRVTNAYQMTSAEERLAQLGFVVWTMDSRGTPGRGRSFARATYLKLGQADLDDQVAGVRQLARRLRFIDSTRVGIYGASYGGYLTLMALLKAPALFSVGVAQSAETDWRSHDAPFTERYLRTPEENPEGYTLSSALPYARNLQGHLLIAYGTADPDVHEASALRLIDALVRAGRPVDVLPYPDERHDLGAASAEHLAASRAEYFVRYLQP